MAKKEKYILRFYILEYNNNNNEKLLLSSSLNWVNTTADEFQNMQYYIMSLFFSQKLNQNAEAVCE